MYETFVEYQPALLTEYRRLAEQHQFAVVDAHGNVGDVFGQVRREVSGVVESMAPDAVSPRFEQSRESDS